MSKFPHLSLLMLLMLPLSLRGMEIEKEPLRGPVMSDEARARELAKPRMEKTLAVLQ